MAGRLSHLVGIVKHTAKRAHGDDMMGMAAGVAYHFLFSTLPLLIFLTALSGQVSRAVGTGDVMHKITTFLFDHLAYVQAVAIRDPIEQVVEENSGGLLSLGAILALWGGKNVVVALMKALNTAYGVAETRSWRRRTLTAILLTLTLAIPILLISVAILVRSGIERWLGSSLGSDNTWTELWQFARWPVLALVLFTGLSVLYCFGPNIDMATWTVFPGAAFAVVLWGASTIGLSLYFQYLGSYATAYGILGAMLAFVFWMYVISAIILIGGELNSSLYQYLEDKRSESSPQPQLSIPILRPAIEQRRL